MALFLVSGILFTLLAAAGAAAGWRRLGRRPDSDRLNPRNRAETRRLQARFEGDEDFTRNFHRPTQNELLETLQALDYLSVDWERGESVLVDHRFKNELAESFPALCKPRCVYPVPVADDLARLFGKANLSSEARAHRQRVQTEKIVRSRATFHDARAQQNALHQISSGPDLGPVEMAPGSLPFRAGDEPCSRVRQGLGLRLGKLALGAAVALCLVAVSLALAPAAGLRGRLLDLLHSADTSTNNLLLRSIPSAIVAPVVAANPTPVAASDTAGTPPAPVAPVVVDTPPAPTAPPAAPAVVAPTDPPSASSTVAVVPVLAPRRVPPPLTLVQQIGFSKVRAVEKYPDLAVPDSEMNLRFVFRYKKLLAEKSVRLEDPAWPEKLAEECAAAVGSPKARKFTQTTLPRG